MGKKAKDTAWLRDLQELLNRPKEKLPTGDGWLTFQEIKSATKRGRCRIQSVLAGLVKSGDYEMFKGTKLREGRNMVFTQFWYRPSSKKKAHRASRLAP